MTVFRFQDLRVYQKTLEFAEWASRIAEGHSSNGQGQIISNKLLDSAVGIVFCIAEGSASPRPVFIEQLKKAKSHVRECIVMSELMLSLKLLNERNYEYCHSTLSEIIRMIGGLIASLSKEQADAPRDDRGNEHKNKDTL
ncbi:MAG: four helix bundle protein [Bacteroidales bacterium]|jgi:four helix bundle protein|nr:four helix bundle protein [Bacteroidales bacterium]MBP9510868.1 four helix bundle protein [Bacteroidales bacterium]MBP9587800.1 four helix bundle protein [Bacteroidales bacterium]MDI9572895.1 four helix bundle protein [Bacteroidota bacterium]